jgi:hypothetical protein
MQALGLASMNQSSAHQVAINTKQDVRDVGFNHWLFWKTVVIPNLEVLGTNNPNYFVYTRFKVLITLTIFSI